MYRLLHRAAVAASSLGVVGGIALTALPASAAPAPGPPPMAPIAAWGADASGPIHFPPVAFATPFDTPEVASNANYTNFLTTGLIIDRASRTTGYSLVNSPLVQITRCCGDDQGRPGHLVVPRGRPVRLRRGQHLQRVGGAGRHSTLTTR